GAAFVPSGLATWEDRTGTRWLLTPTASSLSALKVANVNSALNTQQGWTRPMRAPLAPVVVNGVAFVVSTAEPAVRYALDGVTAREVWTSGGAITSAVRRPALWAGIGQLHVATSDNSVYAFGFAMER